MRVASGAWAARLHASPFSRLLLRRRRSCDTCESRRSTSNRSTKSPRSPPRVARVQTAAPSCERAFGDGDGRASRRLLALWAPHCACRRRPDLMMSPGSPRNAYSVFGVVSYAARRSLATREGSERGSAALGGSEKATQSRPEADQGHMCICGLLCTGIAQGLGRLFCCTTQYNAYGIAKAHPTPDEPPSQRDGARQSPGRRFLCLCSVCLAPRGTWNE